MPNAGKSSLFNALTRAGAQAANYPFTTVEPNVAVVGVPDDRLERVAATVGARPIVHETIQFHDIAGLVRGAHQGEGLGNKFLANIRETDAILHVVRAHDDPQVVHPEGRVDPLADVETIETELLFADLEQAERRLERVSKQAKSLDKVAVAEERWLRSVVDALQAGTRRSDGAGAGGRAGSGRCAWPPSPRSPSSTSRTSPRASRSSRRRSWWSTPRRRGARATAVSARLDAELSELEDDEASAMRDELGVAESGLETVIREAFELLHLIQFFTGGQDKEARAWAIPRGTRARSAAGSDPHGHGARLRGRRGDALEALVDAGGYTAARERALTRVEGRDYVMQDGDVVTFRFTPS